MFLKPRFKAWSGGKRPVNMHDEVQVILYRDTKLIMLGTPAFLLDWNSSNRDRIIAYRVLREAS